MRLTIKIGYSYGQSALHSLLDAMATAVAMAWAVALATALEAAEALALPKEPLPVTYCVVSSDTHARGFAETSMETINQLT